MGNIVFNSDKTFKALNKISMNNVIIGGEKGEKNGKITYACKELSLSNITFDKDATVYNAFEGYQVLNDEKYTGIEKLNATNISVESPSLSHNVINVYTPADGATITIKNSKFNLNVDTSNVLRLSNYMNAKNVNIVFNNVEWTYEDAATESSDWKWAGLVIYQPASKDVALSGDLENLKTWKFTFKNCKYNGTKVTSNNFGEHNQVVYLYNVGKTGQVTDPSTDLKISFS